MTLIFTQGQAKPRIISGKNVMTFLAPQHLVYLPFKQQIKEAEPKLYLRGQLVFVTWPNGELTKWLFDKMTS
jgi:hypothetical protein